VVASAADATTPAPPVAGSDVASTSRVDSSDVPIPSGIAGAFARREHERRVAKREDRVRSRHPKLGRFILAVTDEPQSTTAWQAGARGEEMLAARLEALRQHGALLLHDRRIPGTRANIDHIVVAPSGVYVIDAKRYGGRPHLKVEGGIVRPRVEKLMVGSRECTELVAGVIKQVDLVRAAPAPSSRLASAGCWLSSRRTGRCSAARSRSTVWLVSRTE
jgi:Nuclease-related domain